MPSAQWLHDDADHVVAVLLLDELLHCEQVRTRGFDAGSVVGGRAHVLVAPTAIPAPALRAAADELRGGTKAVGYLAVAQTAGLPDDVEPLGELLLPGTTCTLYRLGAVRADIMKKAPQRLADTIGPPRIEEPDDLKGRAKWFKRRHGETE